MFPIPVNSFELISHDIVFSLTTKQYQSAYQVQKSSAEQLRDLHNLISKVHAICTKALAQITELI
jgi:hypothetical protein